MKMRLLYGWCLLLMLTACNEHNLFQPKPSEILSGDQMISLLVDIHLADASVKLNQSSQNTGETRLYYSEAFAPVFKKHKTTPAAFVNSMKWYSRHIDILAGIYTEVITRLSTMETETRIKAMPNRSAAKGDNPLNPNIETTYLPDTSSSLQIPYAPSAR
jgi:hypothetical protein